MPTPTISGLVVTFPAGCKYVVPPGGFGSTVINIEAGDVAIDACTAGTETQTMFWKQGVANQTFVSCNPFSWTQRCGLSNVSAVVNGTPVASGNVKVHPKGMVYTDLTVGNPTQTADVTYTYKRARYDLIEIDTAGEKYYKKGGDSDRAPQEFKPTPTVGRYPLYYVRVFADVLQLIDGFSWLNTTPKRKLIAKKVAALRAYNQAHLTHLNAKIQAGQSISIGFNGDSRIGVGAGWAVTGDPLTDTTWLRDIPNNAAGFQTRDASTFFSFHDAELRAKYPELGTTWPQATANPQSWSIGNKIAAKIAALSGNTVTKNNWGIGATADGGGNAANGAPNANDATRLANFNSISYDVIYHNFMMNSFIGYAVSDLVTPLTATVNAYRAANPNADIILVGASGINTENVNPLAWFRSGEDRYMQVAKALGCAFVPTCMITFDDLSYNQISRDDYANSNEYNHGGPYEMNKEGEWAITALGF